MTTSIAMKVDVINPGRSAMESESSSTSSSYEKRLLSKAGPKLSCLTKMFNQSNKCGNVNNGSNSPSPTLPSHITFACPKPIRAQACRPITRFGTPPPAGGCFSRSYLNEDEDDVDDEDNEDFYDGDDSNNK